MNPKNTMLGAEQWRWLEDQLKQPAELRLLISSIQLIADEHPHEKWANLPLERDRLYKLLRDTKVTGVVVLSYQGSTDSIFVAPQTGTVTVR